MIDSIVVGSIATNCWIYTWDDSPKGVGECAIIDPGADPRVIISRLKRLNLRPRYILLTHGHFDHIAALPDLVDAFRDAPPVIAIHQDDGNYLGPDAYEVHRKSFTVAAGNAAYVDALWKDMPQADELLSEGSVIGPFTTLHLPGHTRGSVGFYDEKSKTLFSGDTLFRGDCGRTDLPGGSWPEIQQSLRRLSAMDKDIVVYPGHGPNTTIGAEAGK